MPDDEEIFQNIGGYYNDYQKARHCSAHPQIELRIGIIENDVRVLKDAMILNNEKLSDIVHDLQNTNQQQIGILESVSSLTKTNNLLSKQIFEMEAKHVNRYEQMEKRHQWEFMWVIRSLLIVVGILAASQGVEYLAFLG